MDRAGNVESTGAQRGRVGSAAPQPHRDEADAASHHLSDLLYTTTPGLRERLYGVTNVDCNGDTAKFHSRGDLQQSILERYPKALYLDEDSERYCFHEKDTLPQEHELFPLDVRDIFDEISTASGLLATLRVAECQNAWKNLNKEGKADLWRVLNTPEYLWHSLTYHRNEKQWIKRDGDGSLNYVFLKDYGEPGHHQYTNFADQMSAGLSQEELGSRDHAELVKVWISALRSGMCDAEGHTAVFELFRALVHLLPQMDIASPVEVFHKTLESRYDDGCCVSDTSSSVCTESSPARKKFKPSEPFTSDDSSQKSGEIPAKSHEQFGDMMVITRDTETGHAKYLAVIKIHPKRDDDAEEKFLREVLSALQAQNAVFGFLFSSSDVMYYYAERDVHGKIKVEKFRYPIVRAIPDELHFTVHVGAFQMFIMDLLAALVYGISNFSV